MIIVQFNDSKKMIDADFKLLSENAVQLTGKKVEANTSGCITSKRSNFITKILSKHFYGYSVEVLF